MIRQVVLLLGLLACSTGQSSFNQRGSPEVAKSSFGGSGSSAGLAGSQLQGAGFGSDQADPVLDGVNLVSSFSFGRSRPFTILPEDRRGGLTRPSLSGGSPVNTGVGGSSAGHRTTAGAEDGGLGATAGVGFGGSHTGFGTTAGAEAGGLGSTAGVGFGQPGSVLTGLADHTARGTPVFTPSIHQRGGEPRGLDVSGQRGFGSSASSSGFPGSAISSLHGPGSSLDAFGAGQGGSGLGSSLFDDPRFAGPGFNDQSGLGVSSQAQGGFLGARGGFGGPQNDFASQQASFAHSFQPGFSRGSQFDVSGLQNDFGSSQSGFGGLGFGSSNDFGRFDAQHATSRDFLGGFGGGLDRFGGAQRGFSAPGSFADQQRQFQTNAGSLRVGSDFGQRF